jgi:hypothetical protein
VETFKVALFHAREKDRRFNVALFESRIQPANHGDRGTSLQSSPPRPQIISIIPAPDVPSESF